MNVNNQEIEVKFLISDLPGLLNKIESTGAVCVRPRMREVNLRFDTPDMKLRSLANVLRLRQDDQAILTFKRPGEIVDGVAVRTEYEVIVSDFAIARLILESLGFQVYLTYEKYRQNFQFQQLTASVDEMPFGNFIELEGGTPADVRAVASHLGLDWEARINLSYTALLSIYNQNTNRAIQNLSFESFASLQVAPEELGLKYADQEQ